MSNITAFSERLDELITNEKKGRKKKLIGGCGEATAVQCGGSCENILPETDLIGGAKKVGRPKKGLKKGSKKGSMKVSKKGSKKGSKRVVPMVGGRKKVSKRGGSKKGSKKTSRKVSKKGSKKGSKKILKK